MTDPILTAKMMICSTGTTRWSCMPELVEDADSDDDDGDTNIPTALNYSLA